MTEKTFTIQQIKEVGNQILDDFWQTRCERKENLQFHATLEKHIYNMIRHHFADELLQRLQNPEQPKPELYRHKRLGTIYKIISTNCMHRNDYGEWYGTVAYTAVEPREDERDFYTREVPDFFNSFEKLL